MNKKDRKELEALVERLEGIDVEFVKDAIDSMASAEREKLENMPDSLQASERGEAMQDAADALQEAAQQLEEAMENLNLALASISRALD